MALACRLRFSLMEAGGAEKFSGEFYEDDMMMLHNFWLLSHPVFMDMAHLLFSFEFLGSAFDC